MDIYPSCLISYLQCSCNRIIIIIINKSFEYGGCNVPVLDELFEYGGCNVIDDLFEFSCWIWCLILKSRGATAVMILKYLVNNSTFVVILMSNQRNLWNPVLVLLYESFEYCGWFWCPISGIWENLSALYSIWWTVWVWSKTPTHVYQVCLLIIS